MNSLHEKWEAGQKGCRSALLLPLKTGRGGGGGVGTPPAENPGSWCHLHEQSLKRLFIHVHLSMFFVGKEFLMSIFSEYSLSLISL